MGERYLIDTNSLIDYLAESMPANGLTLIDNIFDSGEIIISVISHIELLGFQAPRDYLLKCQTLIDIAEVIPLLDLTGYSDTPGNENQIAQCYCCCHSPGT